MQQEVKVAREKQMQQLLSEMVAKKAAEEARLAQEVIDMTANHTEKLGFMLFDDFVAFLKLDFFFFFPWLAKLKQQHKSEEDRQPA
eukprot:m.857347 g.857347  ORF g.857347 m.857347 type:complete len:86 (-) comp59647_c0_seq6:249-506(-)